MIVLNVARGADITKLVFLDASHVGVWGAKSAPYRTLPASLWDVPTATQVEFSLPGFADGSLGHLRSGPWFLGSASDRRGLIAHNPDTGKTVVEPVEGTIGDLALTPDGKTVLYSWHDATGRSNGYGSRTWSKAGAFAKGFGIPFVEGDGHCIAPLADSKRFVTLGRYWRNPHLTVRSAATGDILTKGGLALFEQPAIAVSPDGKRLVAAIQLSLYIFPTEDLQVKQQSRKDGRKHFTAVAFHPSGKFLAATSNDETVMLYDTATWEVTRTFTWDIGKMRSIAFSPDGTLAAAGSDKGKVVVWDVDL